MMQLNPEPAPEPTIGQWYQDIQYRFFEVVACDNESIEIQFYDGNIEEVDKDNWLSLSVKVVAEPNDGLSPFEELDFNDGGFLDEGASLLGWSSSVEFE